jgi:cell division protein FtsB
MKVKDRIVHGLVEYFENPWSQLADGLSRYHCPDWLTCLSLHLSQLQARSLVNSLLVYDHVQRATVHSALKSKWIDSELDELASLYQTRIETENTRNTRV